MTGALVIVALILVHAVVFFPAEIVNATAGLAFGFWVAFPIVMVSWVRVRADRVLARARWPGGRSRCGWRGRSGWRPRRR